MTKSVIQGVSGSRLSRRGFLVAMAAVMVGGAISACGSDPAAPPVQGPSVGQTPGTPVIVKMTQFAYAPATLTIAKGTIVKWENVSTSAQSVTDNPAEAQNKADAELPAGARPWDSGMIGPGESFQRAFTIAGDYTYFSIPHEQAGMVGTIKVA